MFETKHAYYAKKLIAIWCRKTVCRWDCLPQNLYLQLTHSSEIQGIQLKTPSPHLQDDVARVVDSILIFIYYGRKAWSKIRQAPTHVANYKTTDWLWKPRSSLSTCLKFCGLHRQKLPYFIQANLKITKRIHTMAMVLISSQEAKPAFVANLLINPCLTACMMFLLKCGHDAMYLPGEIALNSLTTRPQDQSIENGHLRCNNVDRIVRRSDDAECFGRGFRCIQRIREHRGWLWCNNRASSCTVLY